MINEQDLGAFFAYWGADCPPAADECRRLDFNDDGHIDEADLGALLGLWGQQASKDTLLVALEWDAENRLRSWSPLSPTAGSERVELAYDYAGRCVEKRVLKWLPTGGGYAWVPSSTRQYVYDGWRMLLELDETGQAIRKYALGLDLGGLGAGSGLGGAGILPAGVGPVSNRSSVGPVSDRSLVGSVSNRSLAVESAYAGAFLDSAGGIGGLLAAYDTNGTTTGANPTSDDRTYAYFVDALGNVTQLVDSAIDPSTGQPAPSFGTIAALYEYDLFGSPLLEAESSSQSGPYQSVEELTQPSPDRQGGVR
ncbi:MAG: hypothetical protein U1D55_11035 [Phycisphaerae bacterium]